MSEIIAQLLEQLVSVKNYTGTGGMVFVGLAVLFYLFRSFRRYYLISKGQARLVIDEFDHQTLFVSNVIKLILFLLVIPLLLFSYWPGN